MVFNFDRQGTTHTPIREYEHVKCFLLALHAGCQKRNYCSHINTSTHSPSSSTQTSSQHLLSATPTEWKIINNFKVASSPSMIALIRKLLLVGVNYLASLVDTSFFPAAVGCHTKILFSAC